jgi:hypothetical protein
MLELENERAWNKKQKLILCENVRERLETALRNKFWEYNKQTLHKA